MVLHIGEISWFNKRRCVEEEYQLLYRVSVSSYN